MKMQIEGRRLLACLAAAVGLMGLGAASAQEQEQKQQQLAAPDVAALYQKHCVACHGADRLGGMGPALLPQSLERLKPQEVAQVLREGRPATQMTGFSSLLSGAELDALAKWLRTAPAQMPDWTEADIRNSRILHHKPGSLSARPKFKADPKNLFVVVEAGTHHMSVLDGDKLEPIHRFATRFALHGGPKFSRDGRFVYLASRDGWVSKYDLWNLQYVAEIRVGMNTRNVAVSEDGKWVLAGNTLPETLVLLRASDLSLVHVYDVRGAGGQLSRVSAVYDAAPRKSFIAALKDIPEVWELPYGKAPRGAKAVLKPRVIALEEVLDDFFFDQPYRHILGASREGKGQVVDLNQGRKVAELDLAGMPHLGSGITWWRDGHEVMASPNFKQGRLSVIDMKTWKTLGIVDTNGPGFFIRSHEATPYAWTDAMMSPRRDTLQIIDKKSLRVVTSVTPSPGRTAAHVEFTRDGRYALVSLMENEGAIVIYDAATFREIKRLPMDKPIGKYNVYNKTTRSSGTSH